MALQGPPTPEQIADIVTLIKNVEASQFMTYATFCLLIYDHLLTFGDEIQLVWQSRSINLVKVLFILNRYAVPACIAVDVALLSGLVPGLTAKTCHAWLIFDIIVETITLFSTTYIITLRIRALWTDSYRINVLMQSAWTLHVLASTGLVANEIVRNATNYSIQPQLNICFGTIIDGWLIWIPAMIFHLVVFVLLVFKSLYTPRDAHTKLMTILLVDGFIYFAVTFGSMFMNLLFWALAGPSLAQLPHYSVWVLSTLAITRLLLSLQRRYHGDGAEVDIIVPLTIVTDGKPAMENDTYSQAPSVPPKSPQDEHDERLIAVIGMGARRSNSPDDEIALSKLRSMTSRPSPGVQGRTRSRLGRAKTSPSRSMATAGLMGRIGSGGSAAQDTGVIHRLISRTHTLFSRRTYPGVSHQLDLTAPYRTNNVHKRQPSAYSFGDQDALQRDTYVDEAARLSGDTLGERESFAAFNNYIPTAAMIHPYAAAAQAAGLPPSYTHRFGLDLEHTPTVSQSLKPKNHSELVPRAVNDPFYSYYRSPYAHHGIAVDRPSFETHSTNLDVTASPDFITEPEQRLSDLKMFGELLAAGSAAQRPPIPNRRALPPIPTSNSPPPPFTK